MVHDYQRGQRGSAETVRLLCQRVDPGSAPTFQLAQSSRALSLLSVCKRPRTVGESARPQAVERHWRFVPPAQVPREEWRGSLGPFEQV